MTYLLDVNVLVALLDPMHQHHAPAKAWFDTVGFGSWATCPITENGVLRVLGNAKYQNPLGGVAQIAELIARWSGLPGHVFWADDVTLISSSEVDVNLIISPNQITDIYLLALAKSRGGKLATFDHRIQPDAVAGGREALLLIPQ
jgi:toxin-antitoxin system PIN domain toxin